MVRAWGIVVAWGDLLVARVPRRGRRVRDHRGCGKYGHPRRGSAGSDLTVSVQLDTAATAILGGMRAPLTRVLLLALLAACSDEAETGEACDTVAGQGECVQGAICEQTDGATICLEICESQDDCAADENCNGLSGGSDLKACHPK